MAKIPKKLCAFRLNERSIITIAKLAVLCNCLQAEVIEYALEIVQADVATGFDSLADDKQTHLAIIP